MKVNHCTMGTGFADAPSADFPIGAGKPASTCKKILGCPSEYPLVVCELPASGASSVDDNAANPGFATFLQGFAPNARWPDSDAEGFDGHAAARDHQYFS